MMLANSNPFGAFTGDQLIIWLAILYAGMLLWEKVQVVVARARGKMPLGGAPENPVYHRESQRTVNWAELGALERRVELLETTLKLVQTEITREFAALRHDGELRATRIMTALNESAGKQHHRIDQILASVARLEGTVEQMNRQ